MVDEAKTGEEGHKSQIKESSTSSIAGIPNGDAKQIHSHGQTQNTSKARQYASYIVRPFVTIGRFIKKGFLLADRHNGGITALATVAIVVLTIFYVRYSRGQWRVMRQQLTEMQSTSALQKKTAAVQFGLPVISINWLGMFELGENQAPHFIVRIQNNGKTNAESLSFAMDIKFSDQRPEPRFTPKDFQPIRPGTVEQWDPIKKNYIQSQGQYAHTVPGDYSAYKSGKTRLYMLGVVQYKDFTNQPNEWDAFPFCKYVTFETVQISTDEKHGYSGPYQDCEEK